jgi:diaminohydroxyphosphoribosylaminopyrimidine deaminase/5-amino-6-(5-phosphoribosylamino)uracil reductase
MSRCIQLAKNGLGTTYPNPLVGCVIVHNNTIIGEGWHYKAGLAHAEVNAIASVTNKSLLKDATFYVSLEPCNHFGKTPPCSNLIIDSGIRKVVIGSTDPNPKVSGSGILKLMEAGCDVIVGILTEKCADLNKRFFTFHTKKRPYIILKWAQTADGFIAPKEDNRPVEKKPVWITNEYSRQLAHRLRAEEQAILAGTQTILSDNSGLTTRDWKGENPIRVILDRSLKIPREASVYDDKAKTIVLTEKKSEGSEQPIFEILNFSEELSMQICKVLYKHDIHSVIIEGGAKTLQTFIASNLWDEAWVFEGKIVFGDGIAAPKISGKLISEEKIKEDILQKFKIHSY